MRSTRVWGLIAITVCAVITPSMSAQTSNPTLDDAYRLNHILNGAEQLYHLIQVARVSAAVGTPPEQGKALCLELFQLASKEKDDLRRRIIGQKSAVRYLSYFDPAYAMTLLREVAVQHAEPGQRLYEDLRYDAAVDLFVNYLEKIKPAGLSTITDASRYLGNTGQYPYQAMAAVVQRLPKALKGDANNIKAETNNILSDALSSYSRETTYRNRDEEFLILLRSLLKLQDSEVSKELVAEALKTYVEQLLQDRIDIDGDYYSHIYTATGNRIAFADRNHAFLFQVFPVIRRFSPDFATQLLQQFPELDQATDELKYISGGFVRSNLTPDEARQRHMIYLQESLVARVKQRAACDLNSASELAQQVSDTGKRVVAFSTTVPALARKDSVQARKLYNEQTQAALNLRQPADRFRADISLAVAAYSVKDFPQYHSMRDDAFVLGINLINDEAKKAPNERIQNLSSFEDLKELVIRSAALSPDDVRSKITKLPDNWLKAYLLVNEAEGDAIAGSSSPPTKCQDGAIVPVIP